MTHYRNEMRNQLTEDLGPASSFLGVNSQSQTKQPSGQMALLVAFFLCSLATRILAVFVPLNLELSIQMS